MSKGIKTREIIKDIKVLDKAADVSERSKNAFIKSKDSAEETQQSRHSSPSEYAADTYTDKTRAAAVGAAHGVKNRLKNPHQKVQNNLEKAKNHFGDAKKQLPKERQRAAEQAKKTADNAKKTADTLGDKAKQAQKTADNAKKSLSEAKRTLQQTRQVGRQTVQTAKRAEKGVKTTGKGVKATGKGTIKAAKKSVKTAEKSAKVAVKTAKTTAQTAKASAKAATKAAVKTTIALVKAAILAIKGLIALIAVGGWIVVLIIIIICLIGLLVGSIFGIFFSGEDSGGGRMMPDVVAELTTEFYAQADEIISKNKHDILDMDTMAIDWPEILAVYAVKVNTDPDNPAEVATLDDGKVARLREILNDTVSLSHSTSTRQQERTVTGDDGSETTETVTITTLTISFSHKTVDEMTAKYGFGKSQKEQVQELLDPQYGDLWAALLGGYTPGSGEMGTP